MSDLIVNRDAATELARSDTENLLGTAGAGSDCEALVRFLAGREERPCRGAFARLAPAAGQSKE